MATRTSFGVWPTNAAGEVIVKQGSSDTVVAGYINSTHLPLDSETNALVFAGINTSNFTLPVADVNTLGGVKPDGTVLSVDSTGVATVNGVTDTLDKVQGVTTFTTPIQQFGDNLLVQKTPFRKVFIGNNDEGNFAYVLDRPQTFVCNNVNIPAKSLLNNNSLSTYQLGSIPLPADVLRLSPKSVLSITLTASAPITPGQIGVAFSRSRNAVKYRTIKAWTTTLATNSVTFEIAISALHASVLKLDQVATETAATSYPYPSQVIDVNTLSNVEIPIYFQFNAPAISPSTCVITGMSAQIVVNPPKRFQQVAGQDYRKAYVQPFPADDVFNTPVLQNAVAPDVVFTHDWAGPAGGAANTAGTIAAQGTANSQIVTCFRTAGLKPGMFPMLAGCTATYAATDAAAFYDASYLNILGLTLNVFGVGNKILSVDSSTQITMEKPLLTDFVRRGKETNGFYHTLMFYPNAETISIHMGQGNDSVTIGQLTGVTRGSGSSTHRIAKGYPLEFPIVRVQPTDPVRTISVGKVVAPNGWLSAYTDANAAGESSESITNSNIQIKMPANMVQTYYQGFFHNADRNVVLITEDGRYTIELYLLDYYPNGGAYPAGTYRAGRAVVTDLYSYCTPNILDRAEIMNNGISYGTRAYGGGLIGGVLRYEDWIKIPTTTTTLESDAVIASKLAQAANAIPHALAMVMEGVQFKSPNYCPDPAVQATKLSYLSYISQFNKHIPAIKNGGTGYAVGESVNIVGGDWNAPMRCVVTTVNAGVVTGVLVTGVGQYRTAPPDAGNLATQSSGSGSGLILNALALAGDSTITTTAQAFPSSSLNSVYQWPATVADGGYATVYGGSFPEGGMACVPATRDLEAEWTWGRKNQFTGKRYTYEMYAVLKAMQKYGVIAVDMAFGVHNPVVCDSGVALSSNFSNLHGDTGAFSFPGMRDLKTRVVFIENASMLGKGLGSSPRAGATVAAPLYPINN